MYWVFAMINNRLAELFFDKIKGKLVLHAHAYVKKSEYKTKKEKIGWMILAEKSLNKIWDNKKDDELWGKYL